MITPPPPPLGAWAHRAACLDADPAVFFPEPGDNAINAKKVCAQCPVIEACLDYALTNRQHHGVWGGLSEHQRDLLHQRAQRTAHRRTTAGAGP